VKQKVDPQSKGVQAELAAVKCFEGTDDPDRAHWAHREAEVLQQLAGKPYVVPFFGLFYSTAPTAVTGEVKSSAYLVMG